MFIGFPSLSTQFSSEYDRSNRAAPLSLLTGTVNITAKIFSHYSGKMVPAIGPTSTKWYPILYKIVLGKFVQVWAGTGIDVVDFTFPLPTVAYPDGYYYLGSSERETLMVPLVFRNTDALLPPPEYIAICPNYMFSEWPSGILTPAIIKWQGLRSARIMSTPLPDSVKQTRRLKSSETFFETMCLATQQKRFVRYPATTPFGGVTLINPQRYFEQNFDDINPVVAANVTLPAFKTDMIRYSPSEHQDGFPSDAGHGLINSGFQTPLFHWHVLDPMGRISCIDRRRKTRTLYGWRRKGGTLHPRHQDKLATAAERLAYLLKYYDRIGAGPEVWRAWQMTPVANKKDFVYVANTSEHTIVEINLATGVGETIAGQDGFRGHQDGATALFDQPRGVIHLTKGKHAGNVFICDEHNSAFKLLDPETGYVATIAQARKVPLNPAVDLGQRLPFDLKDAAGKVIEIGIRTTWGMPGPRGSSQPLSDCQFVHPTQVAELSDGRLAVAHHDEYRVSIVDLEAGTITYFADINIGNKRREVFKVMWPTISVDKTGALGAVDDIFVCAWQDSAIHRWGIDGASHPVISHNLSSDLYLTQGGPGDYLRQFAYPRSYLAGIGGEAIYSGDDASGVHIIRPRVAGDPIMDEPRYDKGAAVYHNEVKRLDGTWRPALTLSHGTGLQHYFAGLKVGADFAAMDQVSFDSYWKKFAPDLTTEQCRDFFYWALWQSAEGIEQLREGAVV